MVVMKDGVKESSLNRRRQQDFPTPESPMRRSLICAKMDYVSGMWDVGEVEWRERVRKTETVKAYEEIVIPCAGHDQDG